MKLRLGTRGSDLARGQSSLIAESLGAYGIECELRIISTTGDQSMALNFGSIGSQGVFVREIEQALIDGEIDIAVHSYKDLPTESPPELIIAATPARIDVADFLLIHKKALVRRTAQILPLVRNARVGTSSARRAAWIRHFRPDLEVLPLRGNVPTRVGRFNDGEFEGIILAGAGVRRLELRGSEPIREMLDAIRMVRLDPEVFVPPPGQGALAVQCRREDHALIAALAKIDDEKTRRAITVERHALALAEGGCDTAFGALCRPTATAHEIFIMAERDGKVLNTRVTGPEPEALVEKAWRLNLAGDPGEEL